jgi:translation initiation factor IF-2
MEEREAQSRQPAQALSLEDVFARFQAGQAKHLNLIVKADVQGSLQPIVDGLNKMSENNEEGIKIRILAAEIGAVTESDVMLARAGDAESDKAIIIAFNVGVGNSVKNQAGQDIEIRQYSVIYKLFEDIEKALHGMLDPQYAPRSIGRAEVRQIFNISRVGKVAGSYMRDGEARRKAKARLYRDGNLIADDLDIDALKRFNEDVSEVRTGYEFGVSFVGFNDVEEGDTLEFFVMERVN